MAALNISTGEINLKDVVCNICAIANICTFAVKKLNDCMNRNNVLERLSGFIVFVLVMSASAIISNGRLFGHDFKTVGVEEKVANDTVSFSSDGGMVVNTEPLGKDIMGYGGVVPLRIYINKDGVIAKVEALDNAETPDFFNEAATLLHKWEGKNVDEALRMHVDAVSGATFSSKAIIANINRGLQYAKKSESVEDGALAWSAKGVLALVVVFLGAVVPLLWRNRKLHYLQLVLNVAVLGLWSGTFVSYAMMLNVFSNGVPLASFSSMAAPLLMLVVAFVYPVFGRPGHYCANMCPLGSAQELMGKLSRRKLTVGKKTQKALTSFRMLLWGVLMLLMLGGITVGWMDYELFTAFIYSSAPIAMLVVAVLILVLSVFIGRPYCRFVCPTGTLMRS